MENKTFVIRLLRQSTKSCLTYVVKALSEDEAFQKANEKFPNWVVMSLMCGE